MSKEIKNNTQKDVKSNVITSKNAWENIFEDKKFKKEFLDTVLDTYIPQRRWFAGKSNPVKQYLIQHLLEVPVENSKVYLLVIETVYFAVYSESYMLPLSFSENIDNISEKAIICEANINTKKGFLVDALYSETFRNVLFQNILNKAHIEAGGGILHFEKGEILENFDINQKITSKILNADQSNTSMIYNDKFFLKIYRKLFRDTNPDYEVTKFLTESTGFKNSPAYAGSISWERKGLPAVSIALMQEKVANQGEAWTYMTGQIKRYFNRVTEEKITVKNIEEVTLYQPKAIKDLSPEIVDLIGFDTLKSVEKLAQRTAEMHIALSSSPVNYGFLPQSFNADYAVWLKNRLMYQFDRRLDLVEKTIDKLEGLAKEYAQKFIEHKEAIINTILNFDEARLISKRIRIHGDYHLGQVLRQGHDFIILDFEGEPESTIRDRKIKQPPIKDVAGMIRSFHYAVYANIFEQEDDGKSHLSRTELFEAGSKYYKVIVAVFLNTYMKIAMDNALSIGYQAEIEDLLKYHLLEKAIYEMGYELNARPTWAIIPLRGVMSLLENI